MYEQKLKNKKIHHLNITYLYNKKLVFLTVLFLQTNFLFSNARLVIKDNAYMVLNAPATTDSVFVVLDNGNANALSTAGTGGNIITKKEKHK